MSDDIFLQRRIVLDPARCDALFNLALGRRDVRLALAALAAAPHRREPLLLLSELQAFEPAARWLASFTASHPDQFEAAAALGVFLHRLDRGDEALAAYERALRLAPRDSDLLYKTGRLLSDLGRPREAEIHHRRAAAHNPADPRIPYALGVLFQSEGRLADAVDAYERALEADPAHQGAAVNLAICALNLPETTADSVCRARRRWSARLPRPPGLFRRPVRARPDQPLTIGFVSGDFRVHQVAFLTIRTLEGLRSATPARLVCYANQDEDDAMTARFRAAAHLWRPILGMDDEAVARLMAEDGIDALVDMSGHFTRNRLALFTRRPAPLAVGWPCFTGTTGLAEMDALIADPFEVPPEVEPFHAERVLRLPGCWITWDPPAWAPEVGPLPAGQGGGVTFGSLSNPQKLNPVVIALWARVLKAVAGSRLLLRYAGLERPHWIERLRRLFAAEDIGPERLIIEGWAPRRAFLETYARIDVALDAFPYSGGVTTLEALWMGVPVVSLPGPCFPGRHSASILPAAGLGAWVARDADDYVRIAAEMVANPSWLADLRAMLRGHLAASALCDGDRHGRAFHDLLASCFDGAGRMRLPREQPAPPALFAEALRHHAAGRIGEATALYRQAVALLPTSGESLHNLGTIAFHVDDLTLARRLMGWAMLVMPDHLQLNVNLGLALTRLDEPEAAMVPLRTALALDPTRLIAWETLGRLLWNHAKQAARAFEAFNAGSIVDPTSAIHLANRAAMLRSLDRPLEAIACARKALALQPTLVTALNALGTATTMAGRPDQSFPYFRMAAAAEPGGADLARWNESLARLMAGDFAEGWRLYESRWTSPGFPSPKRDLPYPLWDGSSLEGRSIMLYWEQGFGDTLQFARYVPLVRERAARVVLECQGPLLDLLSGLDGADAVIPHGADPGPVDVRAPLLSLPGLFGTGPRDVPARVPYLAAAPERLAAWRGLIPDDGGEFKVGLVWKGSGRHDNDRNRSLRLAWLEPMLRVPGTRFFSLQKDDPQPELDDSGLAPLVTDLAPHLGDFADTAAAMTLLDLIVTVDSAPAHLAGALARPVWVFVPYIPDWRWMLDREDSPWYPTMRLFRQPGPGRWPEVIARMVPELARARDVMPASR
ncbi:MAG: tetratricopeptide repeat protein [Alphaproteobacteria bacterium]|nr:tetratricopeptide repeat protein [Alphaproteobacteria bacterium]